MIILCITLFYPIRLYLITWPITNFKILQKLPYDNILWTMSCAFTLLEGANYVQDFRNLFFEIEQYHAKKMCLKEDFIHRLNNGMET